jgi:hypothetical protein
MTDPKQAPVPLRHQRDLTIQRLCDHFAADHLQAEELEQLIDKAQQAKTVAELEALLQQLPALSQSAHPAPQIADPGEVEESQLIIALMGGAERRGSWMPARTIRVIAFMGGAMLDFREVRLPRGVTDVQVMAAMGGVEIIVPPGLAVSSDGTGIMGGFEHIGDTPAGPRDPQAPLLRVRGVALMGGVEITERNPGETAGDARRRRSADRRARREAKRLGE